MASSLPRRNDAQAGSAQDEFDLSTPITSDVILEVRRGKMKPLEGLTVLSGIDKTICTGRVRVTAMGLEGDEHDYTFHGGVDKAVHGYCCSHYESWKRSFPSAAARFRPGGFGENLVFARLNERNIHIGDVFAVGEAEGLLLQVSLPRQPCFKLNQRFGIANFAPQTWKHSRTGWYYRVLREGTVQAGDAVRLVERRHPAWPLVRVQEYLHRSPHDMARVAELAAIDDFGDECKTAFRSRLARQAAQARQAARRAAQTAAGEDPTEWRPFRVVEKRAETARVTAFVLEAATPDDPDSERLAPGAHVRVRLAPPPGGGPALVRHYSLVSGDRNRFELGVALAEPSRGGSRFLHETVAVGSRVDVGRFSGGVPGGGGYGHHVFVAGGVGITAFLAQMEHLCAIHCSCELHYAVRSTDDDVPFRGRLAALGPDVMHLYGKQQGQRLDVGRIARSLPWNARLCVCGPPRLMQEALRETRAAGLAASDVHLEAFAAGDATGDPFVVVVANHDSARFDVAADETLLEVLQRQLGAEAVPSSCEVGNCGTCKIAVRQGRVEHRGTALTDEEKAAGSTMLACVSRGIGQIVVEI